MADANRHLIIDFIQYDYLETLGTKLRGQTRRVLNNYVEYDYNSTSEGHANYEDAFTREASCAM